MKKMLALLSALLFASTVYSADITVKSFSPSSDQAQTLGTATSRWGTVYTKEINDGEGGAVQVNTLSVASAFASELNHNALTTDSRASENSHPIEAITGLPDALRPATQAYPGVMSTQDKTKLDNIVTDGIVYFTPEGNIRLSNAHKLLGTSLDGVDINLVEMNQWDQVDIGSLSHPLNINSQVRPTVQIAGESGITAELIAFLSDIQRRSSWEVEDPADLVTLTSAQLGDLAKITAGVQEGDTYQLISDAPAVMSSWLNITQDGGVLSVNGKVGTVTVDLADFPDIQEALNAKAFVTALNDYAPLNSPNFTGTPKAPTQTEGDNTDRVATTAFVNTALSKSSGAIVGEIRLFPFRKNQLPSGWYFPSGDYFPISSPVGQVLKNLSMDYKADWGIIVDGDNIRLFDPDKFFTVDGTGETAGRFFRPTEGVARLPGSAQNDELKSHTHTYQVSSSGSFTGTQYNAFIYNTEGQTGATGGSETRPKNIGMTPAVYLGVN